MIPSEFLQMFPDFRWVNSPNQSARRSDKVNIILIHHTASVGLDGTISWFKDPSSKVSAHYVIGKDGYLVMMVPEERRAWHGGKGQLHGKKCDINSVSIGIELVNKGNNTDPFPAAQMATLAKLTKYLVDKYEVHPDNVLGHRHTAPGRKTDPADNFDWAELFRQVGLTPTEKHPEFDVITKEV